MTLSFLDVARPWTIVIRPNDLFVYSSTITNLQCSKAVVNANIIALLGDYACYSNWLIKLYTNMIQLTWIACYFYSSDSVQLAGAGKPVSAPSIIQYHLKALSFGWVKLSPTIQFNLELRSPCRFSVFWNDPCSCRSKELLTTKMELRAINPPAW
jgi:hypothetical protein